MKWITLILLTLLCVSCGSVKYVPVETVRTEIEYQDRLQIRTDSVHVTDSVIIHAKGDTVYVERWRERWRDRLVVDTAFRYIERVDSVQVPYPVEKSLTRWQSFKQDVGGIAIGVLMAVLIAFGIWLIIKCRNK